MQPFVWLLNRRADAGTTVGQCGLVGSPREQLLLQRCARDRLALQFLLAAVEDHVLRPLRIIAIVEAHLSTLGGIDASGFRADALARLDNFARIGVLTERDAALRTKLWSS